MRVVTYRSDDAPEGAAAIARIRCAMIGAKGKTVETWHPVVFHAPNEAAARAKAEAWWADELAKEAKRQANYAAAGERLRQKRAAA